MYQKIYYVTVGKKMKRRARLKKVLEYAEYAALAILFTVIVYGMILLAE